MRAVRFWLPVLLVGGAIVLTLAAWMHGQQSAAQAAGRDAPAVTPPRPVAEVTSALRALKLVTVEIDTAVTVERSDRSWRGDVAAKVTVPVRLSYGTDLAGLRAESVGFAALAGGPGAYVVRVPRPARIATEIFGDREKAEVQAGGLRLRSRAGEYYLGLARRDSSAAARDLELLPADAARVEQVTREQVETLVRTVAGPDARVTVIFEDPPAP